MIITILLLVIRFFAGRIILEEFNVIWATDGVYLRITKKVFLFRLIGIF